jgi:hypothetical protein
LSQLLANAGPYSITKTWYVDGTATDVGTVTIGFVDGNGTEVVAAGTATTNNADGTYTYSLADQTNPKQLKATWIRSDTSAELVDRIEVVGNWLFTETQARSFGAKADATSALKPLASATEYTDAILSDERSRIVDDLEYWTGRAWIPRYARVELNGNGRSILPLKNGICRTADGYQLNRSARLSDIAEILSVTISGTAATLADFEVDSLRGNLINTTSHFTVGTVTVPYNVVVEYVYGMPFPVDGVDRIALKILVDRLVPSAYPDRALRVEGEYGTMQLVQPGGPMRNVSRVPEVNQWVDRHDHRVLVG